MKTAYKSFVKREKATDQRRPIPSREAEMVKNNQGGYVFALDDWKRLDRFLILGSDKPTFYCGKPAELTRENALNVERLLAANGERVVARVVEISEAGRAPKNDSALFVLALATSSPDAGTRKAALQAVGRVARIATHLFMFLGFVEQFRGWGRGLREAVGKWYLDKSPADLAYQVIKYQNREWTHRDVLRMAHVKPEKNDTGEILYWAVKGWESIGPEPHANPVLARIWAMERMKAADEKEVCKLIALYKMPFETVPTQFLKSPKVWTALLPGMGLEAMVRNLGRMTANGTFVNRENVSYVIGRLTNADDLKKARLHPVKILIALNIYKTGKGDKGDLTWTPITALIDALDKAFYLAFGAVTPTGKRFMLALDVSRSMDFPSAVIPGAHMTARVASTAMALVTQAVESDCLVVAFSGDGRTWESTHITPVDISPRRRLDDNLKTIDGLPFGGTDCALPMVYALEKNLQIDAFIIYTDNESGHGQIHPAQALEMYRKKTGIDAKLIVMGMTSTGFSIADPKDPGMLDVVGFDAATPEIISAFVS